MLLGSGLSRAAKIPTGWEITLDLVRRVATAEGVEEQDDWEKWYLEREGKEPNYSDLLAKLATTPAERRSILHSYIEPSEEDIEEGRKVPTQGHKAIASLIQQNHIRVIVTTNFDRLMENALREVGVEPTVIASPDMLKGAEPLTHSKCYILKLHGDYKDARILNTDDELNSYPEEYNTLLDRIFDEYGLVVCGWSGEWDHALRAALERIPNRRYPIFWASRGDLKGRGLELCEARKGITIPISDADHFFGSLLERVQTLVWSQKQNPVSVDMLVSRAKKYLSRPEYRIQLSDLVSEEVEGLLERQSQDDMALNGPVQDEDILRRISIYEGASEGLTKICGLIGRWGGPDQIKIVADAIQGIIAYANDNNGGNRIYIKLQSHPAALVYHACILGLQYSEKWSEIHNFMGLEVQSWQGNTERFMDSIVSLASDQSMKEQWQKLPGMEQRNIPFKYHLADNIFSAWGKSFLPPRAPLSDMILMGEALTAVRYLESSGLQRLKEAMTESDTYGRNYLWAPPGRAGWNREYRSNILPQFEKPEFVKQLANSGFGGGSEEFITTAIENYNRLLSNLHWH